MNAFMEKIAEEVKKRDWKSGHELIAWMESQGLSDKQMIEIGNKVRRDNAVKTILESIDDIPEWKVK